MTFLFRFFFNSCIDYNFFLYQLLVDFYLNLYFFKKLIFCILPHKYKKVSRTSLLPPLKINLAI